MATFDEFVRAQDDVYEQVLRELGSGRKRSHWMWFIFPQMAGLGTSAMSQRFGLQSADEARAYLKHPTLGPRLRACTRLMLDATGTSATAVLGQPDDLKFRSSMTLFAAVAEAEPIFHEALAKYFAGERDPVTLKLIEESHSA